MGFEVVPAGEAHLAGILAIYNHAVEHTTAIWNDELVDLPNRRDWLRARKTTGEVLVAQATAGEVLGYGGFGPFRPFDGYRQTVEHFVYVAETARRRGVALTILRALEAHARERGMHVIVGGIAADNEPSLALHRRLGFAETGRMPEVGQKFGRWLDLVLMQKVL